MPTNVAHFLVQRLPREALGNVIRDAHGLDNNSMRKLETAREERVASCRMFNSCMQAALKPNDGKLASYTTTVARGTLQTGCSCTISPTLQQEYRSSFVPGCRSSVDNTDTSAVTSASGTTIRSKPFPTRVEGTHTLIQTVSSTLSAEAEAAAAKAAAIATRTTRRTGP